MDQIIHQISNNAVVLSMFLIAASVFLFAIIWAACRITRMMQLEIATNVTLARELASIQKSLATGVSVPVSDPAQIFAPAMPSSAPVEEGKKNKKPQEGEFYGYNEADMSDIETINQLRREKVSHVGMFTDDELDAHIKSVKDAGFNEDEP
jgi:hypothetical protein